MRSDWFELMSMSLITTLVEVVCLGIKYSRFLVLQKSLLIKLFAESCIWNKWQIWFSLNFNIIYIHLLIKECISQGIVRYWKKKLKSCFYKYFILNNIIFLKFIENLFSYYYCNNVTAIMSQLTRLPRIFSTKFQLK